MKVPEPFLANIIEASEKIGQLLDGFTKDKFGKDERTQLAVIKLLEIIGEACTHLTEDFRKTKPDIHWRKIIDMRNRLTHVYWDIDLNIVWKTATERIPELHTNLVLLKK